MCVDKVKAAGILLSQGNQAGDGLETTLAPFTTNSNTYSGSKANLDPDNRYYRLNAMSNYPFADEYGSVNQVLNAKSSTIPLAEMGAPARAKVIQVTYNSMLNGRRTMKVPDIPDALADLGLTIPPKVLSILYAVGIELESVVLSKNTSASVSLDQFISFVEICISPRRLAMLEGERQTVSGRRGGHATELEHASEEEPSVESVLVRAKTLRPSKQARRREPREEVPETQPLRTRSHGGVFEDTESTRHKRRTEAARAVRSRSPKRDQPVRSPVRDSGRVRDRGGASAREYVDESSVSEDRSTERRVGLLGETASFRMKKREGAGFKPLFAAQSESESRSAPYRESHAARLRRAHSKIGSEVLADKQRFISRRDDTLTVRALRASNVHDDYSLGSSASLSGEGFQGTREAFEQLEVHVSRSPSPGRQVQVMQSAEEFLRASQRDSVLITSPVRHVSAETFERDSLRGSVRDVLSYAGSSKVSLKSSPIASPKTSPRGSPKAKDGWRATSGGWVADFGRPKSPLPSVRSLSPGRRSSQSADIAALRSRSSLDAMLDDEIEAFKERTELRSYARYVPDIEVTHTVPASDPMGFHTSKVADSKHSFERELKSAYKVSDDFELSSNESYHSMLVTSSSPRLSAPAAALVSARESVSLDRNVEAAIKTESKKSSVTDSVEKIASMVSSRQSLAEARQIELFNELDDSDTSFDFSGFDGSPRSATEGGVPLSDVHSSGAGSVMTDLARPIASIEELGLEVKEGDE